VPSKEEENSNLKTATHVYVNLTEPERAAEVAMMHVDGVGLLRAEFMIAEIGIHPRLLMQEHKEKFFIDTLAKKLRVFCEAFSPRPVVYRLSDFKTNEYRNLKGGEKFEPKEENPMIGFRGAYRFIVGPDALKLEIDAVKKVRNTFGFKNLWLMVPYVRTVSELVQVKKDIAKFGLEKSPSFKLWMMVEIPSNVILIDEFIGVGIDGISIVSNDLTMLTLGTDRDNNELANVFSEKDEAVMRSLEKVIKAAHAHKITASICGQAPSMYPDLVEKLVSYGIKSISVNPDALNAVRKTIHEAEKKVWQR
jgi:pyruvate,water dikinase